MIGIDTNTWLVYEGDGNYGRGLWPTPFISQATLIADGGDVGKLPSAFSILNAQLVFREDFFDPVTRLRRGRLYEWREGALQQDWHVLQHPAGFVEDASKRGPYGTSRITLHTYRPKIDLPAMLRKSQQLLVALGAGEAVSLWRVLAVEKIASGEDLVTLRARSNFGALPEVREKAIPEGARLEVLEAIERVVDGAFRSGSASLVDLCRDGLVVVLSRWLHDQEPDASILHKDLSKLVAAVEKRGDVALSAAGKLVARLHNRGKSNVQLEKGTRPLTEEDAELALNAFGFVLQEVGWAL